MNRKSPFEEMLVVFQNPPDDMPPPSDAGPYEKALCLALMRAAEAEAAGIWRLDRLGDLHLVHATNIPEERRHGIVLRRGEGITGAALLCRRAVAVAEARDHPRHYRGVDEQTGFQTRSIISAPIMTGGFVYGALSILNHVSRRGFAPEWCERLSAAGCLYAAALERAGRLEHLPASDRMAGSEAGEGPGAIRREGDGLHTPGGSSAGRSAGSERTAVVGISSAVREALRLCELAGASDVTVVVTGETGTGKELAARRIHEAGRRASGPFVAVNCAALSETLLESELFGHVKGAYTGADRDREGKFVAASGGTLFLDEIGEMSQASQAKILRALQEGEVAPLGSEETRPCDVRVVAATHRNLRAEVGEGRFRADLYYRLCGIEIRMPPLRERPEDIPLLARHFLERHAALLSHPMPELGAEALEALVRHPWPGNVRQLEQAVGAALAVCEGSEISFDHLPAWFAESVPAERATREEEVTERDSGSAQEPPVPSVRNSAESVGAGAVDRVLYLEALRDTAFPGTGRWNHAAAARRLGIPRKTFSYRLRRMGLLEESR